MHAASQAAVTKAIFSEISLGEGGVSGPARVHLRFHNAAAATVSRKFSLLHHIERAF
ncbi:MAG: hypothetical protein ACK56I_24160 [bacterium]